MNPHRRFIPGDRWVVCDVCGFDYRFSQMRKGVSGKQKGFNVCVDDFDAVHPRDTVRNLPPERKIKEIK